MNTLFTKCLQKINTPFTVGMILYSIVIFSINYYYLNIKINTNKMSSLILGEFDWQQTYEGLKYHMEDAYIENNMDTLNITNNPQVALFSHQYYNEINQLNQDKTIDFCFIGSIQSNVKNRLWVIDFAKKYFTSKSVFINTDNDPNWSLLGDFDLSFKQTGFSPKQFSNYLSKKIQYRVVKENLYYFQTMCNSKYILCPAGDSPWSFRFYETLMCNSLPIVNTWHHTYRTAEESKLSYNFMLNSFCPSDTIIYDDMVHNNTLLFKKYHMMKKSIVS